MTITLTNSDRLVTLDGVEARVWTGQTAAGIPCIAYISRIAAAADADAKEFEAALHERPADDVQALLLNQGDLR